MVWSTGVAAIRTRDQNWTRITLATVPVHWSTGGKPDPYLKDNFFSFGSPLLAKASAAAYGAQPSGA
jgi:hypothetical protein